MSRHTRDFSLLFVHAHHTHIYPSPHTHAITQTREKKQKGGRAGNHPIWPSAKDNFCSRRAAHKLHATVFWF